ncbi:hypothetical protein A1O7_00812 [Cladophialophora yegresii CBS 114405]|uniref:Uncharacterized protein n=1 Tax=Cladophialophora yegresii CBS 114405 TaxID=1182544 RepID=W9WIN5_9EURO|nr:uncharacterized protein A1O7_00812 [Cladophialophora yegresii CBS 114405]EXJ64476.1 hypothetical protein A1O7_00812 [Cladophialophora yegresii CBS 114405]
MTTSLQQQVSDDQVRTKHVQGRGNGLFVTQQITPNSQILFIARPLLIALETAKLPTHCYFCYKSDVDPISAVEVDTGHALKTCTGCKVVRFCDRKCQSRAWAEYHRLECKLFGRLHPRILPTTVRAIVRVLKQHKAGLLPESEWEQLLSLESHYGDLISAGGSRWQDIFIMMKGIKAYCGTDHSQETILRLACMLLVNSFTLTNPAFDPLGMVLHPQSALVNHSCDPNTFVRFDIAQQSDQDTLPPFGSISLHALRAISPDEEVTISYIDTTFPVAKRQEELRERYFFTCDCPLCSRGPNTVVDMFHRPPAADTWEQPPSPAPGPALTVLQVGDQAERCLLDVQSRGTILHTQVDDIKSAMALLAGTQAWPLHRYPWPQLRQELFLGLLGQRRFLEATLHSATFVRAIHPTLYPRDRHPLRVMQLWTLARLCRRCLESLVLKEKTVEDIRFDIPMLGLLSCVLVGDTHRLLNDSDGGVTTKGRLEEQVTAAYEAMRAEGAGGSAGWAAAYLRDPGEAGRTAFSWLDGQVADSLKREGVARGIVDVALSRQG